MSSPAFEKNDTLSLDPYAAGTASQKSSSSTSPFFGVFNRFSQWKADLGLPNPGSVENLQREVKTTHLTNWTFDGARADLAKSMSANPLFQVTHSFALGSQTAPPSYNFGALFANDTTFLTGGVDHEGNVNGRLNQGFSATNVFKAQMQLSQTPGHNMLQLEHDYQGQDFAVNVKAMNPWPLDFTGIFIGSYLQSVTKNLAIGAEALYSKPTPDMSDLAPSYIAKWTSTDRSTIATATVQPQGVLQTTYYQKLSEKVDAAADLQIVAGPQKRDAVATIGAKWDLRLSTFRAQLDSTGKVSALLEQRFTPTFAFMLAGEIDHPKNAAKFGVGVMLESTTLTPEEMAAQMPQA